MQQWQFGSVRITSILEMTISGNNEFVLPDASNEACLEIDWLRPHFMDEEGFLIFCTQAFVVDTGDRRILVDTCIGNDKDLTIPGWEHLQTRFLDNLAAAGYPPETIDTVLCTHMHVDHVGWNTVLVDGSWVPTFKNARYLVSDEEWNHWLQDEEEQDHEKIAEQSIKPVVDAGLMEQVPMTYQVSPEVCLKPTPGHTPGHVCVHIKAAGEEAIITGDCIHHPAQLARVHWCSLADNDPTHARKTRETLLAENADKDVLLIGTHFPAPAGGLVKSEKDRKGYRLEPRD